MEREVYERAFLISRQDIVSVRRKIWAFLMWKVDPIAGFEIMLRDIYFQRELLTTVRLAT